MPRHSLMTRSILFTASLILALSSLTYAQANFKDMVTFGDSLTHNDLLGWAYGNPQDMYGDDPNEAVFDKGAEGGNELANYAVAGSESSHVEIQIGFYDFFRTIFVQDKATLFGFEIGGNDILNNIGVLAAYAPGENETADAVIDNLIDNMRSDLLYLHSEHRNAQFIIWTIPDVTLTRAHWFDLTEEEIANARAHMQRVNNLIRWADRYANIAVFDLYTELQDMVEDPPILFGHQLVGPPFYGEYDCLFADEIHPTAVGNAIIANGIIEKVNAKWNDDIPLYTDEELADLAHIEY